MGETVRSILADFPNMMPGDVFITNDPYSGGSHLPDVTVVTPVFSKGGGRNSDGATNEALEPLNLTKVIPRKLEPVSTTFVPGSP